MLAKSVIEEVLETALQTGGDFSEIFVEDRFVSNITLQAGKIDNSVSGRDFGVGIRIFKGLQSAYAYTTDATKEGLLKAAKKASQAFQGNHLITRLPLQHETISSIHSIHIHPREVEKSQKAEIMKRAYSIAKNYHSSIQQVTIRYMDEEQHVLIANSEGKYVEDTRVRSRLGLQSIAARGANMETGYYAPAAFQGFEFMENLPLEILANEASRIAVTMLDAEPCPSGKFPVIIDNESGGVIFHEACGHGLEATAVAKNNSVFANRLGEKVASDLVTYIDDGTLPNEWGSLNMDDEGEVVRKNILIKDGMLTGYLIDKFNSRRMNMPSTGSGRRESYRFAPTSRMTNTYIAPGKSTPEEIIANTEYGIYTKHLGGGSVNPTTGDYNFAVREAYLIQNGRITTPLKGATLIGNGLKTLQLVDMVGNNLGQAGGLCGASSGNIPVNVGQPMVRISEMTVGGRKGEE